MSRSNPTDHATNPATKWIEWDADKGQVRYYDKATKSNIVIGKTFAFMLLDELCVIKGWDENAESGIYSNEIRDTRGEILVVKHHKANRVIAEGLYSAIKDRIKSHGGKFCLSLYIAIKNAEGKLEIANLLLKGAGLMPWIEFRHKHRDEVEKQAVAITGCTEGQKGKVTYQMPTFAGRTISEAQQKEAYELDKQLQIFLASYFKRTKTVQTDRDPADPDQEPDERPKSSSDRPSSLEPDPSDYSTEHDNDPEPF